MSVDTSSVSARWRPPSYRISSQYRLPPSVERVRGTMGGAPSTPTPTPVSDNGSPTDPFGGLSGDDRDAYVAITEALKAYGLESLAPAVLGFIQQGYSAETINVLLQETDAYKQRFAANEARRQKGLAVLSPAEYLATERAYRQVMSQAGLPAGFYDSPDDFQGWLAEDVSPAEIQERVTIASDIINSADPQARAIFSQWYTPGEMVAYALDRDRATQVIDRRWRAAQVGSAAADQGFRLDSGLAERVAETGVSAAAARQGFGTASAVGQAAGRLSDIYGGDYDEDEAVSEVFFADEQAARKRRGLASKERAQFGGGSGVAATSLSARSGGQV